MWRLSIVCSLWAEMVRLTELVHRTEIVYRTELNDRGQTDPIRPTASDAEPRCKNRTLSSLYPKVVQSEHPWDRVGCCCWSAVGLVLLPEALCCDGPLAALELSATTPPLSLRCATCLLVPPREMQTTSRSSPPFPPPPPALPSPFWLLAQTPY